MVGSKDPGKAVGRCQQRDLYEANKDTDCPATAVHHQYSGAACLRVRLILSTEVTMGSMLPLSGAPSLQGHTYIFICKVTLIWFRDLEMREQNQVL